ncbi:MAG: hypothetical protein RIK87_15300 [Fuerstiella sp.]
MLRLATKFLPTPENFAQAFHAGFRNAELYLNSAVLEQTDDVLALARQFDMRYAMHFPNKPELSPQHLEACCRLFDELQISAVVIHPPMMKRYGPPLRALHSDLILAVETMRVPPDELTAWARQHGAVTLDIEHLWKFSLLDAPLDELFGLVRRVFEEAADCVSHIHMPGYLPGHGEHRPMYTSREFCLGVFDILADFGFGGLVVSEVDMAFQNPQELQMDVLLFDHWQQCRAV